ncbi:Hypothetical predicted protein [Xyrichtys novacula]|uniref:Uncharacterized protein n=1 Tax=Xyrichtys novacula TaxID=13765 RepID=A0AAV1GU21_XYRNO|nr:Hypothetical predicted protein [Xyrichtys novacula]
MEADGGEQSRLLLVGLRRPRGLILKSVYLRSSGFWALSGPVQKTCGQRRHGRHTARWVRNSQPVRGGAAQHAHNVDLINNLGAITPINASCFRIIWYRTAVKERSE